MSWARGCCICVPCDYFITSALFAHFVLLCQELALEGISMSVGVKALGHSAKAMAAAAEAAERARAEAEMQDRPDASPRPNNLDFHEGFRQVNSNMFLRVVGASLGVEDEVARARDGTVNVELLRTQHPKLILGLTNLYDTLKLNLLEWLILHF